MTPPDEQSSAVPDRNDTNADMAMRDEASEEEAADDEADPSAPVEEPVELVTGSFDSRNRYTVTGSATAYELP